MGSEQPQPMLLFFFWRQFSTDNFTPHLAWLQKKKH